MNAPSPELPLLAIDVETANKQDGRICQIGIAEWKAGRIDTIFDQLINPKSNFLKKFTDDYHGITKEMVNGIGEFDAVFPSLHDTIANRLVFSWHTFDPVQINAACDRYSLPHIPVVWLDACKAARELWPHFREYKLNVVADHFGITFNHHNAASDARTCLDIMTRAIQEHSLAAVVNAAFHRPYVRADYTDETIGVSIPIDPQARLSRRTPEWIDRQAEDIARDGNPDGPHYGGIIVLSGNFTISREQLADRAHAAGFRVKGENSLPCRRTTYLIRGENGGARKSERAQELINKGHSLQVISEMNFFAILEQENNVQGG